MLDHMRERSKRISGQCVPVSYQAYLQRYYHALLLLLW